MNLANWKVEVRDNPAFKKEMGALMNSLVYNVVKTLSTQNIRQLIFYLILLLILETEIHELWTLRL